MDIFSEEQFITKPEPTTSRSHKFFKTLTCSTDIQGNCYYAQKIVSIYPKIYWMEFPSKEKIAHIADTIKAFSDQNSFLVWNLSQTKYDTSFFSSQVAELSYSKYSWLSLNYIMMTCKAILKWLNSDPSNIAIIHCQSSKRRSAIIMACLLCLLRVFDSPLESLTYFCKVSLFL